tara:strand:- start:4808 stop:7201 length:2394 start_codon:yes stop_codon:yes gene_type:complete
MALIENIISSSIERKHIIRDKPLIGDISQYTFNSDESDFSYENSTSLPKSKDRFQNKDLNTTVVGDKVNERILERNIKSEEQSFIRINKCFVEYVGTPTPLSNVSVTMWMCSWSYTKLNNTVTTDTREIISDSGAIRKVFNYPGGTTSAKDIRVFTIELGDLSSGENVGNLSALEGVNLISNIISNSTDPNFDTEPPLEMGAISGINPNYGENVNGVIDITYAIRKDIVTETSTSRLFNVDVFNPLYLIFELKGDAPGNTRDSIYQIFQINNLDLGQNQKTFSFDEMFAIEHVNDIGDSNSPEDPALKITDLEITIDTKNIAAQSNTFSDASSYSPYFPLVKPSPPFLARDRYNEGSGFNFVDGIDFNLAKSFFLTISPKQQLMNNENDGIDFTGELSNTYKVYVDYFPKQKIGIFNTNTNQLESDIYLGEYRNNQSDEIQSMGSSPALVSFEFEIISGSDNTLETLYPGAGNQNDHLAAPNFYYFVLNWDDKDNEIKSLDDWLDTRPTTIEELTELQQDNLYLPFRHYQKRFGVQNGKAQISIDRFEENGRPVNLYTTPGIKTIKTIMFNSNYGYGTGGAVGRWKLITSRIYIGVSKSESPDFGQIGGDEYTTIPWPYTTPIIGGVDDNSKYKKSIRESISCAKLSFTDVIDEELLSNDLENDEMGKSINQMDLEQVRYFNKSYDINSLLNISTIPFYDDFDYWDGGSISSSFSEESLVGQILINDNLDLDLRQSCKLELNTGNLTEKSIYDSSGNSNKGLLIGDYKIKKPNKGTPMRRDSFIKVPKKTDNTNGAL